MSYKIKLIAKETIADGTMAFHFEKPEGFSYQAGQYADFTLINPAETDDEGDKRTFSLASAPYQSNLTIATRMRDTAFKRVLKNLPEGSELELEGPYGSFALPKESDTPAVFLTGGIGCTFVRSMVMQATHDQLPQEMLFLYSNRAPKDAAFLDEFNTLAAQNQHFTFVPTMTELGDQAWDGERGFITLDMLKKYVKDVTTPVYYLSGPGTMVGAMRQMLLDAGVNKYNLRTDQYAGY